MYGYGRDEHYRQTDRRRNRRGEGGKLREEIIAAAVELLDEGGDERAVTLRSVARQSGDRRTVDLPALRDQPSIMLAVVQRGDGPARG